MCQSEDLCMWENLAGNITKHVKTESSTSKNEREIRLNHRTVTQQISKNMQKQNNLLKNEFICE